MNKILVFTSTMLLVVPCFAQEWVAVYDGPASNDDEAHAITVDGNGNVYVTGESPGIGTQLDYATIKYGPAGDTLWVRRYNGPASGADIAQALAVDEAGKVYVTGSSYGSGTYRDYATIKYDPNGDTIYVRRYNGPANNHDLAYAIAVDGAGSAYVTGQSYGSSSNYDYLTIKYYPDGDTAWTRRYNGPANNSDRARAIAVDGAGNVYVVGESQAPVTYGDYATIKYDSLGDTVWVSRYNGPGNSSDEPTALAVDASGNVYVTGKSQGSGTDWDYATVKYDSLGDTVWVRRYDGPESGYDYAEALAVDGAGNVYVTGCSYSTASSTDFLTIKYYPNGDTAWVRSYNGPNNFYDEAYAIAVDGAGNVYVAGWSISGGGASYDYVTVKYNSAGEIVWNWIYNGPESYSDYANAIAVDDEYVYVTGRSFYSATSYDYATIKYLAVGVAEEPGLAAARPALAIYPNPSYSAVSIRYSLTRSGQVILNIYDACGRLVRTLVDGSSAAGTHTIQWDGKDSAGKRVPHGIYFFRMAGDDFKATDKLTVLK